MDNQSEAIRQLQDELESVKQERDQYKSAFETTSRLLEGKYELLELIQQERDSLQRDKAALIEVLEWYGDTDRTVDVYQCISVGYGRLPSMVQEDAGERARTILAKMKG